MSRPYPVTRVGNRASVSYGDKNPYPQANADEVQKTPSSWLRELWRGIQGMESSDFLQLSFA